MKRWQIIGLVLLFIAVVYLILTKMFKTILIKQSFQKAKSHYSDDIVRNAERIYRLETNHFKSGQFQGSGSAGMEKAADSFPYGWNSLKTFWNENLAYRPIGFKPYTESGTGKTKYFLNFPTIEGGVMTVCEVLKLRGNNAGAWYSTDATKQAQYNNSLKLINTPYTDATA
jgi:hypothetical protein